MTSRTLTFPNDHTPLDLLLFGAFAGEIPGLVEQTLRNNPGLAAMGPFPPRGTIIEVVIPTATQRQPSRPGIKLYD